MGQWGDISFALIYQGDFADFFCNPADGWPRPKIQKRLSRGEGDDS
jgi:hypothetical protein